MDAEMVNVVGGGAVNGTNSATVEATLSAEEFQRLQEQLLELRNRNYELMEENKRQQNYINVLPSKGNDTLNFASKLMGRKKDKDVANDRLEQEVLVLRSKLSTQEEEFRLQQSTLLLELNKVISQCEYLEKQLKEKENKHKSSPSRDSSNMKDVKICDDRNDDLKREICRLKDIIAEKDGLISGIEKFKEDLIAAKSNYDEQIAETKKQLVDMSAKLEDSRRCNEGLETSLRTKNEEIALLNASIRDAQHTAESNETDMALIQSLQEEVEKMKAQQDEWTKARNEETAKSSQLTDEIAALKANMQHSEINWKKSFDKLRSERDELINEKEELLKTATNMESMEKELEECRTQLNELQEKLQQTNAALDASNKAKEELLPQLAELQRSLQVAIVEKEMAVRNNEENCKLLNEQLFTKQQKLEELARTNEAEIFVVTSELKSANSDLEMKIKENEEKLKAKDQEMKIALKKQSSMVRELRRQVLQEKKRAEQAERQLDEVLGGGRHFRVGGSPSNSDHARASAEPASSVCSWAFIADSDANSVHTLDGEESSCSASVLESDNAELIAKLALLQKKHSETTDRLNMLEEENVLLRKEISEKNELIAEWIRSRPSAGDLQSNCASPSMRLRRVFDMVRVDESAADIRDMNRRLQRMLEETLSKNLLLQKDLELLLEKKNGK